MRNNYRKRATPFFIDCQECSSEKKIIYPFTRDKEKERERERKVLSAELRCSGNSFRSIGDATLPEVISSPSVTCRERKLTRDQRWGYAPRISAIRADVEIPSLMSSLSQVNDKRLARCCREIPKAGGFPRSRVTPSYSKRVAIMRLDTKLFRPFLVPRSDRSKNWSSYIRNSDSLPDEGPEYLSRYRDRAIRTARPRTGSGFVKTRM